MYDLLVLGSGVAGLSTALGAARRGLSVVVLTKGDLAHTATRYAQGGVAAALGGPDSPELHQADTMVAGAELCDPDAVRVLVSEGPERVRALAALGANFDTLGDEPGGAPTGDDPSRWLLAREGGHSLARVVHAGGDATGAEIERALVDAVERSDVEIREGWLALDLIVEHGSAAGVVALDPSGAPTNVRAYDTVIATGGAGQCFAVTTNPTLSTGDGIALALRAGVACADLEFVQFHPTALHVDLMPRPLLSEALRGEGAILRTEAGDPFMAGVHPLADLAPRDVVSRTIAGVMRAERVTHVWLDATMIDDFARRFPTIWGACTAAGLDPTVDWLPVAPAAHYLSGGVVTDLDGATSLPRLWACGEAACSGVHGANRLASNSLLDGLVFGDRVVAAVSRGKVAPESSGALRGVLDLVHGPPTVRDALGLADPEPTDAAELRTAVQRTMSAEVGVVRDAEGLGFAAETLADLARLEAGLPRRDPAGYEVANLALVARALVAAAQRRQESRGSHTRADFPEASPSQMGRWVHVEDRLEFAPLPTVPQGARR